VYHEPTFNQGSALKRAPKLGVSHCTLRNYIDMWRAGGLQFHEWRTCPRRTISDFRSFFIAQIFPVARSRHIRTCASEVCMSSAASLHADSQLAQYKIPLRPSMLQQTLCSGCRVSL
jgi:hypothetical protein